MGWRLAGCRVRGHLQSLHSRALLPHWHEAVQQLLAPYEGPTQDAIVKLISHLRTVAAVFILTSSPCYAWGPAHIPMTQSAFDVQSPEFRAHFSKSYIDQRDGKDRTAEWLLSHRFTMHPDAVDGPSRNEEDIPERIRVTRFVYAQRDGKFMAPIAYSDPDKESKGPRPKTYHYFVLKTEELNREFADAGARWYFKRIALAFKEGRDLDAAEYLGAFAHAIEDRVSPYHVWDGYAEQREAVENEFPELQEAEGSWKGNPSSTSLIWALDGKGVEVDLALYEPKLLGEDIAEAAKEFTKRLFQSREHARKIYSQKNGYIAVHLKDNWKERQAGSATVGFMSELAEENAKLVADVMRTAWEFSRK